MIMVKLNISRNSQHFVIFLCCLVSVQCLDPISGFYAAAAAVGSGVISGYRYIKSQFTECCDDYWLLKNTTGLQNELKRKLFGQHLVLKAVVNHVRAHIENKHPPKALALSFHGGTGTGKNYVSKIVAEHLYKAGMKSKYVHLISSTKEFPHEEMVHFYKDQLRNWIETNVSVCSRSLFIFDEMDKMPAGLLDTIKPYLDYYEQIGGTDYRNAIFIFLSNTAGRDIINFTFQKWTEGVSRDNIKLKEIENIIIKSTVNVRSQRGLWHSELITKHLITAYLPFLPLEKTHVMDCVRDAMVVRKHYSKWKDVPGSLIQEVLNELTYFPENEQIFSITGCKRVIEKVDYVMLQ